VFPASKRALEDSDVSGFHDVKTAAGLALGKDRFARRESAWDGALVKERELSLGKPRKDRNASQRFVRTMSCLRHADYCIGAE
jgi:hypothetical protein